MPIVKNCSQISKNVLIFQICVHVLKNVHISNLFGIFKIVLHFTICSKNSKFVRYLKIVPISKFCSKIRKMFTFTKSFCSQFKNCSPFKNCHALKKYN